VFFAPKINFLELSFGLPNVAWFIVITGVIGLFGRLAYMWITDTQSIRFADELLSTYDRNYIKGVELGFWHNANKVFKRDSKRLANWYQSLS
jgi:hypothetical protein